MQIEVDKSFILKSAIYQKTVIMNWSFLFFLAFCLSVVLCLKPSPGCGNSDNAGKIPKQVVDTIHVTYNDKLLGPLNRRYLIQIPRCKYFTTKI